MTQYGVDENPFDALEEDSEQVKEKKAEPVKEKKAAKPAAPAKVPEQSRTLDAPTKRGGAARFPRGGRGGRGNGNRAPRRVFERHSGTGRGHEVRKGGYGGYDAVGTMQDDIKSVEVTKELNTEDAKPVEPVVPEPEQPKEETEEEKKEREEKEKEAKLMSYDQYLEQQKKKAVEEDLKIKIREVEVDEKKFKACKKLEKTDDNDYADIMGSNEKDDDQEQKKGEKKKKKTKHLDEVLAELSPKDGASRAEYRGGRGGRGGMRGRGGRGGRGGFGRAEAAPVNIGDEAAFPKLGK